MLSSKEIIERPEGKFKSLLIEKDKIDSFEKNFQKISEMKQKIKNSIDIVINELKEKIEHIDNLSKTFFESLEKEIKNSES